MQGYSRDGLIEKPAELSPVFCCSGKACMADLLSGPVKAGFSGFVPILCVR